MTEEQNKQQYESFVTSCINGGQLDMIVGYKDWLATIRAYKPMQDNYVLHLSTKDAEKFVDMLENPPIPTEELKRLLKNEK